jgi:hypothetical protein
LTKYRTKGLEEIIKGSFAEIDQDFLKRAQKDFYVDTSGSCALVLLVIGKFSLPKKIRQQVGVHQCWGFARHNLQKKRERSHCHHLRPQTSLLQ